MEKLLNPHDKECMKLAMLKHEQTFREQVNELHRLYQIQKILMKDISKNKRYERDSGYYRPEILPGLDLERPKSGGVSEFENDQADLELTLGPRSYYHKKIKAAETSLPSNSGSRFSSSSCDSSNVKRTRSSMREELKWGLEMNVSNQDRISDHPPRFFQAALSLNMT